MKTRAKPKSTIVADSPVNEPSKLPVPDSNPGRIFVLNRNIDDAATVITLAHPRTLEPTRYFMCPKSGLYELRSTLPDPMWKRSALLDSFHRTGTSKVNSIEAREAANSNEVDRTSSYVLKDATTYTTTPIDPLFLILPALFPPNIKTDSDHVHFRSADDILEALFDQSKHFSRLAESPVRSLLEQRMAAVCDTVEAGDEVMYRLSMQKLLAQLMQKAKRMSSNGLPASIEDKFVARPLEVPLFALQPTRPKAPVAKDQDEDGNGDRSETQSSVDTHSAVGSLESQESTDTALTVPEVEDQCRNVPSEGTQLQRLRTAMNMLFSMYVPPHLVTAVNVAVTAAKSSTDFSPLERHLEFVNKVKADAAAARSMSDFSRKRGLDDDEMSSEKAEKKRKLEEEEKRKKSGESRGVRDLKKVNVHGMKKMSDFFKKAPVK